MSAITWLNGRDLITVYLATSGGVNSSALTLTVSSGDYDLLPAAPFFLFFPGNQATSEQPEYVYVSAKTLGSLSLTISAPPTSLGAGSLGANTAESGRGALRRDIYAPAAHPAGAAMQLRSTWEHVYQLQLQLNTHGHTGGTDGTQITTAGLGTGAATGAALGSDVVILTGSQTISGLKIFTGGLSLTLGGDSTNDMFYRNSSGNFARIPPAGNVAYVLGNSSGVPTWSQVPIGGIANGAATGAVLGSDVVVLTGPQTISGLKTFTGGLSLTLGSDATNDMFYRNSSGNFARIAPPGSVSYVLGNSSGVPTWGQVPVGGLASGSATGAVLGSDVVVLTGTQTITGAKIFSGGLTVTVGSDATNDMYKRGSGGTLARIAPASDNDYVLGNVGGAPGWALPPAQAGPYNILVNGGMEIWQRNTDSTTFAPGFISNQVVSVDRWHTYAPNSNLVITRVQRVAAVQPQSLYAAQVVVAGATGVSNFTSQYQVVENAGKYAGQYITLAGDMVSTVTGSTYLAITDISGNVLAQTAVNTSANVWGRYSITYLVPTNMTYFQVRINATIACTYIVDNLMLCTGKQAPWYPIDLGDDFRRCQRYYEVLSNVISISGYTPTGPTGDGLWYMLLFKVTKGGSPTITIGVSGWAAINASPGYPFLFSASPDATILQVTPVAAGQVRVHGGSASYISAEWNP